MPSKKEATCKYADVKACPETSQSLERKRKKRRRKNITAKIDADCDPLHNATFVERDLSVVTCVEREEEVSASSTGKSLPLEVDLGQLPSNSHDVKRNKKRALASSPNAASDTMGVTQPDSANLCTSSETCADQGANKHACSRFLGSNEDKSLVKNERKKRKHVEGSKTNGRRSKKQSRLEYNVSVSICSACPGKGFGESRTGSHKQKTSDDASTTNNVDDNVVQLPAPSIHEGAVGVHDKDEPHALKFSLTTAANMRKKLLILDLNGVLADIVLSFHEEYKPDKKISGKAVFKRPFCDEFLQFCFEKFDVGVWSSRIRCNVDSAVNFLMGSDKNKLLFCWDQSHCTKTGYYTLENRSKPLLLKELKKLWTKQEPDLPWKTGDYDESNTLLVDDSPYKALRNPPYTAIFPYPYDHQNINDGFLGPGGNLCKYLKRLAAAENVQTFVQENPFGQSPITKKNSSWAFYAKIVGADEEELKPRSVQPTTSLNGQVQQLIHRRKMRRNHPYSRSSGDKKGCSS